MEPITATILVCLAIGWGVQAGGKGVAHAAAGVRGKPSPVYRDWDNQEQARRAAGHAPRRQPNSVMRTAWANAVEKWVTKSEQRHYGRMEALRERGPDNAAKAKKWQLRRWEFRARVASKAAGWFSIGRDRMQRISSDLREVVNEKRAERVATRAGDAEPKPDSEPSRQQQAAEAVAELDKQNQPVESGPDARVIPIDRTARQQMSDQQQSPLDPSACPINGQHERSTEDTSRCRWCGGVVADGTAQAQEDTNNGGSTDMAEQTSTITATQQQTTTSAPLPEPTDLPSAINYSTIVAGHLGNLGGKLGDDATIFANNAESLNAQAASIETAQAEMAKLGFEPGGEVQDGLGKAAELTPAAAENFAKLQQITAELGEQLSEMESALKAVAAKLGDQQGLADEVQSQAVTAGVANETRFYREG